MPSELFFAPCDLLPRGYSRLLSILAQVGLPSRPSSFQGSPFVPELYYIIV